MTKNSNRPIIVAIILLSLLITTGLTFLIYGNDKTNDGGLSFLPGINALFNAAATIAIAMGIWSIKNKRPKMHITMMISAVICSTGFLIGYLIYHYYYGNTIYEGGWRGLYLALLASHIILSFITLPLVLITLFMAISKQFKWHRLIAKVCYPLWLYVSISGVLIYLILKFNNHY